MNRLAWTALVAVGLSVFAYAVPPGSAEEIRNRLAPVGTLCRSGDAACGQAGTAAATGPMGGAEVYKTYCALCHTAGVGGAPVFGDNAQWQPRIAKGMEVLMSSTLNGLNAMPARGTCMSCSDEDLNAAVDYMLEQVQ